MEKTHSGVETKPLVIAADLVASICDLPAVATQDWCDRAAGELARIRPRTLTCLGLGSIRDDGSITRIEVAGAACPSLDRRTVDTDSLYPGSVGHLGWAAPQTPAPGEIWVDRLRTTTDIERWQRSARGKKWTMLGVNDLVIGLAGLTGEPGRCLVVELGILDTNHPVMEWELAVTRTLLPHVVRRASMAFGAHASTPGNRLTNREQQVLEHLSLGKSVKQIAEDLSRSPHTVHDHVKSLHRKLNASSRGELIARALGHIGTGADTTPTVGRIEIARKTPSLMSA